MANTHPRGGELRQLAEVVAAIEVEQKDHPDYCESTLRAIVDAELRKLARESEDDTHGT
jgi:hypothetical protein